MGDFVFIERDLEMEPGIAQDAFHFTKGRGAFEIAPPDAGAVGWRWGGCVFHLVCFDVKSGVGNMARMAMATSISLPVVGRGHIT